MQSATVDIAVPYNSNPGRIEVQIGNTRPSIFAGILGLANWQVGSRAVAANESRNAGPFAMLALDPSGCAAIDIQGQGELISNGNIQVNSACPNDALLLAGQGEILTAPGVACNIVGDFSPTGQAQNNYDCTVNQAPNVQSIPDPYETLGAPAIPTTGDPPVIVYPPAPVKVGTGGNDVVPIGCPGSATPATHDAPATCHFPGSYSGTTWRLYPGYYPGGINLESGTFYLEPGIYWIGGGGVRLAGGSAAVRTVDEGGTSLGGGILIYNSSNPNMAADKVVLQGGGAGVDLYPLSQGTVWDGMVVFVDRTITSPMPIVEIVGASSTMQVRGIIYAPNGTPGQPSVLAQGNGGEVIVDQIIAYRFRMAGNIGSLTVAYDAEFLPDFSIAGLVE
jgi:hypothetical protein